MRYIEDYLGVSVEYMQDREIKITQLQIIQYIINQVCLPLNTTIIQTPALVMKFLRRDARVPKFDVRFHYPGAIR